MFIFHDMQHLLNRGLGLNMRSQQETSPLESVSGRLQEGKHRLDVLAVGAEENLSKSPQCRDRPQKQTIVIIVCSGEGHSHPVYLEIWCPGPGFLKAAKPTPRSCTSVQASCGRG